jgi:serine/threonine protein kinase
LLHFAEPPDADPHVRWCGEGHRPQLQKPRGQNSHLSTSVEGNLLHNWLPSCQQPNTEKPDDHLSMPVDISNDDSQKDDDGHQPSDDSSSAETHISGPEPELPSTQMHAKEEEFPDQIGRYRILQPIGKGGMGQVFMAEQSEPVKRRVALKIIKTDTPTKEILARFEAERQALAMMDHQNIAKVLDAGVTDDGRPYFAMELVKGVPITEYCDTYKLNPDQRLELFVQTCCAIQHAHQKGIVHRDIKPTNVLVSDGDDGPTVKVIDFGLAKAIQESTQLTERTLFTQHGQVVGTLAYMSPEQAEMSALDVDTRTDVYSLGVLLYELLTGTTPISQDQIREEAFDRILRLIREEDPPRPSVRLSESGDAITDISQQRRMEPRRLGLILKGDLDWITVKALEKDRNRRYETASALGADVKRYLAGEAIEARPPSASYRFKKFVSRHRSAVAAVVLLAGGMMVATSVSVWFAIAADKARQIAEDEKDKADLLGAIDVTDRELLHLRWSPWHFRQEDLACRIHIPADKAFKVVMYAGPIPTDDRLPRENEGAQVPIELPAHHKDREITLIGGIQFQSDPRKATWAFACRVLDDTDTDYPINGLTLFLPPAYQRYFTVEAALRQFAMHFDREDTVTLDSTENHLRLVTARMYEYPTDADGNLDFGNGATVGEWIRTLATETPATGYMYWIEKSGSDPSAAE